MAGLLLTFAPRWLGLEIFADIPLRLRIIPGAFLILVIPAYGLRLAQGFRASARAVVPKASSTIIILRSFADDHLKILDSRENAMPAVRLIPRAMPAVTFEEILCSGMAEFGRPVAVGRPDEVLLPIGADRVGLSESRWQEDLMPKLQKARAIVLIVGSTPGIRVEMDRVCQSELRDKTVFVVPPVGAPSYRARVLGLDACIKRATAAEADREVVGDGLADAYGSAERVLLATFKGGRLKTYSKTWGRRPVTLTSIYVYAEELTRLLRNEAFGVAGAPTRPSANPTAPP